MLKAATRYYVTYGVTGMMEIGNASLARTSKAHAIIKKKRHERGVVLISAKNC